MTIDPTSNERAVPRRDLAWQTYQANYGFIGENIYGILRQAFCAGWSAGFSERTTSPDETSPNCAYTYDVVAYNSSWNGYGDNASREGFKTSEEAIAYAKSCGAHLDAKVFKRTVPIPVERVSVQIYPPEKGAQETNTNGNQAATASSGAGVAAPTPRGSLPNSLGAPSSLKASTHPHCLEPDACMKHPLTGYCAKCHAAASV